MDEGEVAAVEPVLVEQFLQPTRLRIIALLSGCASAQFRTVRDRLELSDSLLSKHVAALKRDGFATVRKTFAGTTPQTWLSLTCEGRKAFLGHVAALQQLAADAARPDGAPAQEAGPAVGC